MSDDPNAGPCPNAGTDPSAGIGPRMARARRAAPDVVFVRRLRLALFVGVEPSERERRQTVLVSVRIEVDPAVRASGGYLSYAPVVERLRALAASEGHVELVETIAEIAARAALEDPRTLRVEVTVEKPDIYPEAEGVGVTIAIGRGDA